MKMNHIRASKNTSQSEPCRSLSAMASEISYLSNSPADATSDGVFVDGMAGSDTEITRGIWHGEAGASTDVTSLAIDEDARAVSEVGAAGSSVDLWDII